VTSAISIDPNRSTFGPIPSKRTSVTPARESNVSLAGLCLVLASSVLVVGTVWFLPASAADRRSAITPFSLVAMAAVLLWVSSLPRRRSFLLAGYPILVFLGVATVGADTASLGTSYVGLFTLSFVYVGLTMPRNTAIGLAPVAAVCWWACNRGALGAANGVLIVRLAIALVVWVGVAELLAGRTRTARAESGRLIRAAGRDPLTGLDNRRSLDALLDSAAPGDAFVLLDLDHFKNVNDAHGHAVGDLVLTDFADVVTNQLRALDTAIRYGGEEVLLHLPQTPIGHVGHVLTRLRDAWAGIAPLTTFSAGAALVTESGRGREALLTADKNLYLAKANGRDQAVL
jgi:diguanylate cyclase (GGDEF)-like protein